MTSKLPVVGKKYRWKHAPHRYHLVIGFLGDKIVAINDRYLCEGDDEALDCAELMTFEGFRCLTNFEELPDSNPQEESQDEIDKMYELEIEIIKLESDLNIKKGMLRVMERNETRKNEIENGGVSEVERALEELKNALTKQDGNETHSYLYAVISTAAQNLVNALEAERNERAVMSKPEPKIDIKEERVEPVSIWKDVGELPKFHCQVLVKFKNHQQIFIYDCDGRNLMDYNGDELALEYVESFATLSSFVIAFEQMQRDIEELKKRAI